MRKFITLSFLFIITTLCACKTQQQTAANNVSWKKVKVFVYTKNGKGYVHDNIAAAARCIQELGAQNGFAVDVSDDPAKFNDDNLKQYNALVFTSTNNDVFDNDAQKLALMHYIQAGGGFVGIHSVTGTERNWPWFKRLVGGTFERHAKHQPFTEIVIDHNNPSTSFLPDTWKRDDECYYTKEINPDIHVLMVHDLSTVDDKGKPVIYGNTFPSVWCHEFDGGREWYTSLGHDSTTYKEPEFRKHIMGGLQWVLSKQKPLDYSKAHAKTPNDPLPY
ncbi:ThuA domain-containing protein [Parafilimonas terrae]|jgi:type 1 glutamine amidotransferase|uniref:Type 1 glutamine amidotransferase (GATase1) n=1 Tax=Parafilimonas terrae TaxID=1465490 RepID=A0A1I5V441_9BACT|nr:ThuA domain-containing protein [Parafilimonas terrae]SFQ02142.1 Type 1 glutamine amidotransferase (GATase1) [Parafilimonas terrae]